MPPKRKISSPRGLGTRKKSRPARFQDAPRVSNESSAPPLSASRRQHSRGHSRTYAEAAQGLPAHNAALSPPDQPQVSFDQPAPLPATPGPAPVSNSTGTCMSTLSNDVIDANCIEIPSIASVYDPIGSFVPIKLKEKIWEGKFVDLSLLLKSARELEIEMETSGELVFKNGRMTVQKTTSSSPLYDISSWTSAFLVYMSIVLEKQPNKSQELLKYMRDIRLASNRSQFPSCWVKYDEQYRLKKANNPSSSWGVIDSELWLICMSSNQKDNPTPHTKQWDKPSGSSYNLSLPPFRSPGQNKVCFAFNKGKCTFPKCKYQHSCANCSGQHPASNCKKF